MNDSLRTRALLLASAAAVGTVLVRAPSLGLTAWFAVAVAALTTALIVLTVRGVSRSSTRLAAWVTLGLLVALGVITAFTAGPALLLSAALLGAALVVDARQGPDHRRGRSPSDDGYSIELRWKEEVIYWEGQRGYVFPGGWGVTPPVTYVPSAEVWDDVVPPWLRGRRSEVVSRLEEDDRHVIESDPGFQPDPGAERSR